MYNWMSFPLLLLLRHAPSWPPLLLAPLLAPLLLMLPGLHVVNLLLTLPGLHVVNLWLLMAFMSSICGCSWPSCCQSAAAYGLHVVSPLLPKGGACLLLLTLSLLLAAAAGG